jgi:hypothetical protein
MSSSGYESIIVDGINDLRARMEELLEFVKGAQLHSSIDYGPRRLLANAMKAEVADDEGARRRYDDDGGGAGGGVKGYGTTGRGKAPKCTKCNWYHYPSLRRCPRRPRRSSSDDAAAAKSSENKKKNEGECGDEEWSVVGEGRTRMRGSAVAHHTYIANNTSVYDRGRRRRRRKKKKEEDCDFVHDTGCELHMCNSYSMLRLAFLLML